MKVSEIVYNHTVTCELCGRDFVVNSKFSRAKRCPECVISIRSGIKREGFRHKSIIGKWKVHVSNLDTLAREAKKYGLSYGKYVGLKRAGYKVRAAEESQPITHSWDDWIDSLYRTVSACKARAEKQSICHC